MMLCALSGPTSMNPAGVNRKVEKAGSKWKTLKDTSVMAHTLVFSRIVLSFGDRPWRRNVVGEASASWACIGGAILMSAESWSLYAILVIALWMLYTIVCIASCDALLALKLKMQRSSFSSGIAVSHWLTTAWSMSSKRWVLWHKWVIGKLSTGFCYNCPFFSSFTYAFLLYHVQLTV